MPVEMLSLVVTVSVIVSVWFTIRLCADAVMHGGRGWWRKAIYLAQQRQEYRAFSKSLDEELEIERMVRK